ncbi:MAG: right-handed parallel beta-helix repeat-containing protein [Mangrovibacterium sp.]
MKQLKQLIAIIILLFPIFTVTAQTILYVSPDGRGDRFTKKNPGSLEGARDKVRSLTVSMNGDIVVNLYGGTYFLESAFKLGPEDSGNNSFSVIWQAAPGEKPVLSGGKIISRWTLFDRVRNIYSTNVGNLKFRQLYVGGIRAVRARTPNRENFADKGRYSRILSWNNFHPAISASLVPDLKETQKVEFCVNMYWQHFRYRIESISTKGDSAFLSFKMPEAGIAPIALDSMAPFILENAFEFLDAEGEWFLDPNNGILFYKPRKGEKMAKVQVIAPAIETVLNIEGTTSSPVHHIKFQGISFEHSTWLGPNERGYTCAQAAFDMEIPGMVKVSNANKIVFERNRFSHAGGFGLVFSAFSSHNAILGNVVSDISANGIVLDPTSFRENAVNLKDSVYTWMISADAMQHLRAGSSYDVIRNNLVEFCGMDYNDAVGIYASLPEKLLIEHNEVRFLPYTGISLGWSWLKEKTPHRDCEISFNKIHDVCLTNPDGGAIYNLGTVSGDGTRIHHNYVYNVNSPNGWAPRSPMVGLYCDGPGATNVLLDSNVVRNCVSAFQNGSHIEKPNLRYSNNYWQCEKQWFDNGALKGCEAIETGNTRITDDIWPEEAVQVMKNAGIEVEYQYIIDDKN